MRAMVREAVNGDLKEILELYLCLHEQSIPRESDHLYHTWKQILEDENHHLIVNEKEGKIVSSCVCVIIPNLTRNVRPYAFIENVVTQTAFRGLGLASECLEYAQKIAKENNCYKMMLLTGSKQEKTLNFYRKSGYNSSDKTAFIQWLDK
jgi:ribosomal protein S18 acetylase RimI-like enzyme